MKIPRLKIKYPLSGIESHSKVNNVSSLINQILNEFKFDFTMSTHFLTLQSKLNNVFLFRMTDAN